MSQLHLPQELIDYIIEYLWDDRVALKACALVRRSFLPYSQRQLFSLISLSLLSSADSGKLTSRATSVNFQRILQHSPHLASYVRRLEIHGLEGCLDDVEHQSGHREALISCLSALCDLRALKLGCRPGVVLDVPRWNRFVRGELLRKLAETMGQPQLVCLEVDRFPLSMVILCPTVRHLTLSLPDTRLSVDPDPDVGDIRNPICPESLQIDLFEPPGSARNRGAPVEWLLELNKAFISLSKLKTLHISTDVTEWQESCGGWTTLKDCSATLETLSFDLQAPIVPIHTAIASFHSSRVLAQPLDWSSMKKLRELHIRIDEIVIGDQWGTGGCDLLPWILGLLKALKASGKSPIEEVIIQVNYQFMDDRCPHFVPWKDIVAQLCDRNCFHRLKRVRIMVASESKISYQREAINRQIIKYVRMHNTRRAINIVTSVSHKLYHGIVESN